MRPEFSHFHYSNKASALTPHALRGCLIELAALPDDLLVSICNVGGKKFTDIVVFLRTYFNPLLEGTPKNINLVNILINFLRKNEIEDIIYPTDLSLRDPFWGQFERYMRKLIVFPEFEGKTRIIAILDY